MIFKRLELAIGLEGINKLENSTVLVIGVGGVGSFSCESLARSGIGTIILVDKDIVDITNINRQIIALQSTIGMSKVEVMKSRILDINPNCNVICYQTFFNDTTLDVIENNNVDFVIDACDTVTSKYFIIEYCLNNNIPFISSMGAANKIDPTSFKISTLDKTTYDPIARVLRKKVKDNRLKGKIPVVYSTEKPMEINYDNPLGNTRKEQFPPSSNAYTPSVCGLICTSFVINSLLSGEYFIIGGKL